MSQEREVANTIFKSKKGKELQKEIAKKSKTFVPGAGLPDTTKPSGVLFVVNEWNIVLGSCTLI
jgi:U2 small nuclear ribonucleoprotein A'